MAIVYPLEMPSMGLEFDGWGKIVANFEPVEVSMNLNDSYLVSESTTRKAYTTRLPGSRWEGELILPAIRDEPKQREWLAFLVGLRGQLGTFKLRSSDWKTQTGDGSLSLVPAQTLDLTDTETLELDEGGNPIDADLLNEGHYFAFDGRLRMVHSRTDEADKSIITFMPEVGSLTTASTVSVEDDDIYILSRLSAKRGWSRNILGRVNIDIPWKEVL